MWAQPLYAMYASGCWNTWTCLNPKLPHELGTCNCRFRRRSEDRVWETDHRNSRFYLEYCETTPRAASGVSDAAASVAQPIAQTVSAQFTPRFAHQLVSLRIPDEHRQPGRTPVLRSSHIRLLTELFYRKARSSPVARLNMVPVKCLLLRRPMNDRREGGDQDRGGGPDVCTFATGFVHLCTSCCKDKTARDSVDSTSTCTDREKHLSLSTKLHQNTHTVTGTGSGG